MPLSARSFLNPDLSRSPPSPPETVPDSNGESALDGLDLDLSDFEMDLDTVLSVATGSSATPESRAGSGTVPSGLHFTKMTPSTSSVVSVTPTTSSKSSRGDKSSVCLFCGSNLHVETDCSLKAKAREVRDKEAEDQEAPRTDKSSSKEILIIDDPVYFPLSSKKSVTFEKTDEVKEAKEAKFKRKAEKAESRAAAEKGEANASTTRKRRHSARHTLQVGAEQEIAIPATLSQDVSLPIKAKASVLLQSTNLSTKDVEFLQQRESYLQRQLYVCGYSLKYFFSLHKFLDWELSLVRAEYEEDTEMADDEADDIVHRCLDDWLGLNEMSFYAQLLTYPPILPFGCDKFHPDEMSPFVWEVFAHLKNEHLHTCLALIHPKVMGMNDIHLLAELHTELKGLHFGSNVTSIVVERLQELTPGNGGIQFLRFPASADLNTCQVML
ncbi:hypothetical protein DFH08DRAFT_976246 [Mycena albidolilacea]|uniref:Uncharacterized protein n=1 Tax=Mycena albidolilacea TaxID=1033008 RepID=A0AAD6Z3U0_9AGAR|nr:hypothetical protein DFH08DRAFT_976246 [Mycena albidolilacea]